RDRAGHRLGDVRGAGRRAHGRYRPAAGGDPRHPPAVGGDARAGAGAARLGAGPYRAGGLTRARASVARRLPVLARFAGAGPTAVRVAHDRLVAAVGAVGEAHAVALAHQFAHGFVGEAGLQFDPPAVGHRRGLPRRLGGAVVLDARRVTGLLQVHAEVDQVEQDLHV